VPVAELCTKTYFKSIIILKLISYSDYLKHKEVLKKYIELKNESARESSKDKIKEWLSGFGVRSEIIPEEEIVKMLKDLEINK